MVIVTLRLNAQPRKNGKYKEQQNFIHEDKSKDKQNFKSNLIHLT